MSQEQIERNDLIVKMIQEGKSYAQVGKLFGKAKITIAHIYWRRMNKGKYAKVKVGM